MSLLELNKFENIFAPLENRKVGFLPYPGNIDIQLGNIATSQLLDDFHLDHRLVNPEEFKRGELFQPLDIILVSAGGNMDSAARQRINSTLAFGVPVNILPMSITDEEIDITAFAKVFVRDKKSLQLVPGTILAPELALALRRPWVDEGIEADTGIWLRHDNAGITDDRSMSLGDPADISPSADDYFGLASKFEHIITDRLYFAIAGLLLNRRVTLLPDASQNNRAVYENWLKDLGCRWRNGLSGISNQRQSITENLWKRLSSPPSGLIGWNTQPCHDEECELIQGDDSAILHTPDDKEINLSPTAMVVWSLCDGEASVEDICTALAEHYQAPLLDIARDVQSVLQNFKVNKVLKAQRAKTSAVSGSMPSLNRRNIIDVDIQAPRKKNGRTHWSAWVRGTSLGDFIHYFEFDTRWRSALTNRGDPFVLALLPRAMHDNADLRISGAPVDAQLLDHLDEYQQAWHSWRPDEVKPVCILTKETIVSSQYVEPSLTAFSGGLDSMHTICRHTRVADGRRKQKLAAALMACGFDIPVNDRDGFNAAIQRLRPVTDDAGIELIEVYTNIRTHIPAWVYDHGAALASALCLFSGKFGRGLIPSTFTYQHMNQWGSNPVSDPLLGGAFSIEHDSAALSRFDKLLAVAHWPAAVQALRVCWMNRDSAKNCGHCEKCYALAMGLQALGQPLDCFDAPPDASLLEEYAKRCSRSGIENSDFSRILEYAVEKCLREPWVETLQQASAAKQQTN